MISTIVMLAAGIVLFALLFFRLRRSQFSTLSAAAIVALMMVQSASALTAALLPSLLLALTLYFVSANAIEFSRQKDARIVLALGASLSAVQLLPLGFTITAALVPLLAWLDELERRRKLGLLVLMLFMPGMCAIGLAYLGHISSFNSAFFLSSRLDGLVSPLVAFDAGDVRRAGLAIGVCLAVLGFPLWLDAIESRASAAVAFVALAVIVAVIASALFHRAYGFGMLAPSFAAIAAVAIGEQSDRGIVRILGFCTTSAVFAWLAALSLP